MEWGARVARLVLSERALHVRGLMLARVPRLKTIERRGE